MPANDRWDLTQLLKGLKLILMKYVIQTVISKYSCRISSGQLGYLMLLQHPNLIHTPNYRSCMCAVIEMCSDNCCCTLSGSEQTDGGRSIL